MHASTSAFTHAVAPAQQPGGNLCTLCSAPLDASAAGLCRSCYDTYVCSREPQHNEAKVRTRRSPVFVVDTDGTEIAVIPTNIAGKVVKMCAEDLRDLTSRGFTDQVTVGRDAKSGFFYAYLNVTGTRSSTVSLSRLILNAGRKRNVTFADGDRLNLRRDNLVLVRGHGRNTVQLANKLKESEARAISAERA